MARGRSGTSQMNFGDVVYVDFGTPIGSETGFKRPAIVLIEVVPDPRNNLTTASCALVEQLRAIAIERCGPPVGNIGPLVSHQILDILAMITGMP